MSDNIGDKATVRVRDAADAIGVDLVVVAKGIAFTGSVRECVPYVIYDPTGCIEHEYENNAFWATFDDLKTLHKSLGDIIRCHEFISNQKTST